MNKCRRDFIKKLAYFTAVGTFAQMSPVMLHASNKSHNLGLAELARLKGIDFGCAITPGEIVKNSQYERAIQNNCTIVVAETHMKWNRINPSRNVYTFEKADAIVKFAQKNKMKTRFHGLVWHAALPDWVAEDATDGSSAEKILRNYSDNVLTRYSGQMRSWDIVNEPIKPDDGNTNGFRSSIWYEKLGPDYVAQCFKMAKEYDLGGDLVLNETKLYSADENSVLQRKHFLNLVRDLKDRDIPVDAVGLQSHLKLHVELADREEHIKWLEDLKETGVKIFITEMDVNDGLIKGNLQSRALSNASYAREFLDRVFAVTEPEELIMWGIWDGKSFINWQLPPHKQNAQPTIFSKNWQRNPLYNVVSDFLMN